MPKRQKQQR